MQAGNPQWCWGARGTRWCSTAGRSRKAGQWHTRWSRSILKSHLGKFQNDNIYSFTSLNWTWIMSIFMGLKRWNTLASWFLYVSLIKDYIDGAKMQTIRCSDFAGVCSLGQQVLWSLTKEKLRVQSDQPANVSDKPGSQRQSLQLCCDRSTKHAQPNTVNERVCYHLMLQFSQWSTPKSS